MAGKVTATWLLPALLVMGMLLGGCSGLPPEYLAGKWGVHVVKKGDTLYSVAFRYGLDDQSLARINRIRPPYTIYIGQTIKLRGGKKIIAKDSGPDSAGKTKSTRPGKRAVKAPAAVQVSGWQWPLSGEVIAGFSLSPPLNKGIDIAGRKGEKVAAAADGIVVYAGGNLRGYGKLVIIKHNDSFLSAYGNNAATLVKEGERIKAGGSIARVGNNASGTAMLHFEIRRVGKPVNPCSYLPAKSC